MIALFLLACTIGIFIVYSDTMPDYGIKSRWKKLALKTLLSEEVPKISVAGAKAEIGKAIFLDTRSKKEFAVSHIAGALFTGYEEFDWRAVKDIPKHQPIITYCSIGKRSDVIAQKLLKAGYTQVKNMYGGLFEWINNGFPVVDNQNKATQKVHAYNRLWGTWLKKGEKLY